MMFVARSLRSSGTKREREETREDGQNIKCWFVKLPLPSRDHCCESGHCQNAPTVAQTGLLRFLERCTDRAKSLAAKRLSTFLFAFMALRLTKGLQGGIHSKGKREPFCVQVFFFRFGLPHTQSIIVKTGIVS